METAGIFFAEMRGKTELLGSRVSALSLAYHLAALSEHLVLIGKTRDALTVIDRALQNLDRNTNVRVQALLTCSRASVFIALNGGKDSDDLSTRLSKFLPFLDDAPQEKECVFRTLISLYSQESAADSKNVVSKLNRQLTKYIVARKARHFFADVAKRLRDDKFGTNGLCFPYSVVPRWLALAELGQGGSAAISQDHFTEDIVGLERTTGQVDYGSPVYQAAEVGRSL